jgi:hypothetical protein
MMARATAARPDWKNERQETLPTLVDFVQRLESAVENESGWTGIQWRDQISPTQRESLIASVT